MSANPFLEDLWKQNNLLEGNDRILEVEYGSNDFTSWQRVVTKNWLKKAKEWADKEPTSSCSMNFYQKYEHLFSCLEDKQDEIQSS